MVAQPQHIQDRVSQDIQDSLRGMTFASAVGVGAGVTVGHGGTHELRWNSHATNKPGCSETGDVNALVSAGAMWSRCDVEPVSGIEPLTCRLQDGRSAY